MLIIPENIMTYLRDEARDVVETLGEQGLHYSKPVTAFGITYLFEVAYLSGKLECFVYGYHAGQAIPDTRTSVATFQLYNVRAKMVTVCEIDVWALDEDHAITQGREIDGGSFIPLDPAHPAHYWEVSTAELKD